MSGLWQGTMHTVVLSKRFLQNHLQIGSLKLEGKEARHWESWNKVFTCKPCSRWGTLKNSNKDVWHCCQVGVPPSEDKESFLASLCHILLFRPKEKRDEWEISDAGSRTLRLIVGRVECIRRFINTMDGQSPEESSDLQHQRQTTWESLWSETHGHVAEVRSGAKYPLPLALWRRVISQHKPAAKLSDSRAGVQKGAGNKMCDYP